LPTTRLPATFRANSPNSAGRSGRTRLFGVFGAAVMALVVILTARGGAAQEKAPSDDAPAVFTADTMTYDSERRFLTATGNVEVTRDNRLLRADVMTYDEVNDVLAASGNVVLKEPTGEVVFADRVEVTGDLKTGTIEDLRAILANGARLAAASGKRVGGVLTETRKTVYSPCDTCPSDPERAPLWQVKGVKVRHNQEDRIVEFMDSWMEIEGIPVFYLPYFYMPDPTVKRKTGLLAPTFGASSDFGFFTQVPFFWAIAPNQDATITPWFTTEENAVLEGQYRLAMKHGAARFDGSITHDSRQRQRGHLFGDVLYDINDTWRAGAKVERALGRTYLRRYNFSDKRTLTSQLYAEAFDGSNYFSADSFAFEGLAEEDDNNRIPVVAPRLDYNYLSAVDPIGGRTDVALNGTVFTREEGTDTRRLSARADWNRPVVGTVGELYTATASLWGDFYDVNNLSIDDNEDYSGTRGRVFPQAGLEARMPFMRPGETITQVIEPIAEAVVAPQFGNSKRIPNEDSQDFNFEETNLFGLNRFPGLDRVEEGSRINYGVDWSFFGNEGGRVGIFSGQSYRFFNDDVFPQGSGLDKNWSDVVNAVYISPNNYVDLIYRNRVDVTSGTAKRQEIGATLGTDAHRIKTTYVHFDSERGSDFRGREEIDFDISTQLTRFWRARIEGVRNLTGGGSQRELGVGLTYEDECFLMTVGYRRNDFEDRDVEPSNTVFVRLGFKTLGAVGGSRGLGG